MGMQSNVKANIELARRENHHTIQFENGSSKQYVLSKYTPQKDAVSQIGEDKGNKQTVWIILGFALGYIVKQLLLEVSEYLTIIIIEPSKELLEQQMAYEENYVLEKKENIHFICGDADGALLQKITKLIPNSELNNIKILGMKVYLENFLEYYKMVNKKLQEAIIDKIINLNTLNRFNLLFIENTLRNRKAIQDSYQLSTLQGKYKNIPALIVSAGPSLNKNIEYVKDFKGLILVGNRTIAPVIEQGVTPDFIVTIDPGDIVLTTTRGMLSSDIPMIANENSNSKIIAAHNGKKYFVNTYSNSKVLLGVDITEGIPMGGSVATLCTSVAQYIGCNPIVFIGQDCAYTDMKVHADSCSNELLSNKDSNNQESIKYDKIEIDEYYGGKVWSSPDLIASKRWFEKFIVSNPGTIFINATEGGANIVGAVNKPFEQVVKEYQADNIPDLEQYDKKVIVEGDVEKHLDKLCDMLHIIILEAQKAVKVSEQLEQEYRIYKGKRIKKIRKCIEELNEVDKILKENGDVSEVTAMIFTSLQSSAQSDIDMKGNINETEVEEGIRISKVSLKLYSDIEEACRRLIKLVQENR